MSADIRTLAQRYLSAMVAFDYLAVEENAAPEGETRDVLTARCDAVTDRQAAAFLAICDLPALTIADRRAKAACWLVESHFSGNGLSDIGTSLVRDILDVGDLDGLGRDAARIASELLRRRVA